MKELIKEVQEQWKIAKANAVKRAIKEGRHSLAQKLEECKMFRGTETLEQLISLMFTPKGVEFLVTYNFPSIEVFRKFKMYHPERYGMYIDCGKIALSDNKRVFLVGNTVAELKYSDIALYRLNMMHGANATVSASGYSVVRIEKDASVKVEYDIRENAKIIW